MSVMAEYKTPPEDVGNILVKVQEDLLQLKERLAIQAERHGNLDLTSLENAIHKTEQGLREHTENISHTINNRVTTIGPGGKQQSRSDPFALKETTWDLKQNMSGAVADEGGMSRRPLPTNHPRVPTKLPQASPAEIHRAKYNSRVMRNPHNVQNRNVLDETYGIQLPLIADKRANKPSSAKVVTGSTIDPLTVLPKTHRVDPQLIPPSISENDARHGILSLIQRGLIPPAAELTLDPAPVDHRLAPLHDPSDKEKIRQHALQDQGPFQLAGVRFDDTDDADRYALVPHIVPHMPNAKYPGIASLAKPRSAGRRPAKISVQASNFEMPFQPLPPPTTPASGDFKANNYRFAIQNGKVKEMAQDFMAFKQHYCLTWGSIVTMLKYMERMLTNYAVPLAFINGDRLADLSLELELEHQPSLNDLLSVIVNREDVRELVRKPGQRYKGPNGMVEACTKIQSTFRRHYTRKAYLEHRRLKWASGVIAISWVMNVKMSQVRKQLKITRITEMESFRTRTKKFATNWNRIKNSKRVIIHIPSMGYAQQIRDNINEFGIRQNTQFSRLCDLRDPNTEVIYISPVPVNDETLQYYSKLLGLKTAIDSGDVADQSQDIQDRYKIIVPEAIKSFPTHRMCLATHLKYSPRALRRIKNLIKGKDAYIVPGMVHIDDLSVAHVLDVPILSPEPDVAHLYSSKSGSKRIFASANVLSPPSEYDVYSIGQVHESLSQLVTENLEVRTWLFKLDNEVDGRGIAFCHVTDHLRCHAWALKESQRYGDKWSKKWAQEPAYMKIQQEIPEILDTYAEPCNKKIYTTWEAFLDAFLSRGGVIEACPPSDSITALKANMLIEPYGRVSIVSAGDQIHAESPYACWGVSLPQSSVEPEQLNSACFKIAEACKARGVIGYFSIDFVTFIDPKTDEQILWAVDLSLAYSDSLALTQLMHFVTNGKMDVKTHTFDIQLPVKEKQNKRRRKPVDEIPSNTSRYAVASTKLLHSNLAVVHYSVFFQMCRAHGIGFDVKEKQGSIFTLIDSFNRENLGMLVVGDNLQGALSTFARNLSVIHQEISAPNMQGTTNFKDVIEDIEAILGTTVQNADEESQ